MKTAGFALAFCCVSFLAQAEVILNKSLSSKKNDVELVPNLSVTFNLNSTLDEESTEYYSAIVEELLKNLPRRVELHGENKKLLESGRDLDHMKVVAYLPTSNEDGLSGDRDLRYFDVEFFAPKKKLSINEIDGISPEAFGKAIVVQKGRYEDFLKKVSALRSEDGKALMDVDNAFSKMEKGVQKGDSLNSTMFDKELNRIAKEGSVEKIDAAKLKVAKPQPPKGKVKPVKVVKSGKAKPVSRHLEVAYFDNSADLSTTDKAKMVKFIQALKGKDIQKIRVVSQSLEGSDKSALDISNARFGYLKNLMKEQGVQVSSKQWSAIMVQAPFFQSLKIEAVY